MDFPPLQHRHSDTALAAHGRPRRRGGWECRRGWELRRWWWDWEASGPQVGPVRWIFFWYIRYIRITVPSSLSTKLFGRDKEGLWKICNKQKHETRTTLMVVRSVSFPPHIFWIFEMSRMCFNKLRYEERCVELTVVLGFFLGAHQCLCQFFLWLSNR